MKRTWIAFALLVGMATVAAAEDKVPKPGPEHQRLAFFAGEWKTTGETKETPFGVRGEEDREEFVHVILVHPRTGRAVEDGHGSDLEAGLAGRES